MSARTADVVRFGIAGLRRGTSFVSALARVPHAELAAAFDPSAEAGASLRDGHPRVRIAGDFAELLDSGVDAVYLASPQQHHVPQAVAALRRGIHVLSEIPPVAGIEQAHDLVAACRRSDAHYMMAENHCYFPHHLTVEAMVREGLFGDLYYAEGEYLYEARHKLRGPDGRPTWQGEWHAGRNAVTYPTHTLGPLLRWMDTRLVAVAAAGAGREPGYAVDSTMVLLGRTTGHALVTMRQDLISYRPREAAYVAVQGSNGAFESGRGPFDRPRVHIRGRSAEREWEPLGPYAETFLPGRYRELAADESLWKTPYGPTLDFVEAIRSGLPPPLGVYAALDTMLPGIMSEASAAAGGSWVDVPDPRFFTDGIGMIPGREWPLT
jgi:predicted dehydrogenase